ncbi:hypothetical protein C8R47DRAFT_962640 [Mycena vitilis]|nr:hypothetical protein C8R47DRAFT_962640 [Mycena vitilis]
MVIPTCTYPPSQHFKAAHPKVVCPQPCGVELFQEDLEDHYRESAHHPVCLICCAGLKDDVAYSEVGISIVLAVNRSSTSLLQHGATEHPEHRCTTCERQFPSTDELAAHFVASAAHPSCLQCKLGFVDDSALAEHGATEHPEHRCTTCERQFPSTAELADHFARSAAHAKCFPCKLGFADDAALDEHNAAEHHERRCRVCKRQLASTHELVDHFLASPAHPKCFRCKLGFTDDTCLDEVGLFSFSRVGDMLMWTPALSCDPCLAQADRRRRATPGTSTFL